MMAEEGICPRYTVGVNNSSVSSCLCSVSHLMECVSLQADKGVGGPSYTVCSWADVTTLSAPPTFPLPLEVSKEILPLILLSISLSCRGSVSLSTSLPLLIYDFCSALPSEVTLN